jgi:hypothetical protein
VSADHVNATFYAQVQPTFGRRYDAARHESVECVRSAKVVSITQSRPERPRPGVVVVKLAIRIPEAAFLPLRPEAIVVIPEDMTAPYPIEVEAGDPS